MIDQPSILVPKPENATQQSDVTANINVKLNMRFGPSIMYDRVSGANMPAEITTGDKVTFFEPGVDDGKGRLWVYAIRHRAGTELHGWLSKTDFGYHPVTKPLPPIASLATPANITPLGTPPPGEPPIVVPPAVPQFDPPVTPAEPPQADSAPAATMTPESAKTPVEREIRILITASDEQANELTAAILSLASALTEFCKTWGVLRGATPNIEVKL